MLRMLSIAVTVVALSGGTYSRAQAAKRVFVVCLPLAEGAEEAATKQMAPFLRRLEKLAGWPAGSVEGHFYSSIAGCEAAVRRLKPAFGLVSQGLYLEKRRTWGLKVIGRVDMPRGAGRRLYLVVKKGAYKSLDELRGKVLKSNHVAEVRFLSKVIFRGKVDAGRFFRLRSTSSPLRGFKAVYRGRADCTLVNDEELKIMRRRREGKDLEVIYQSPVLPGTPVVAFRRHAAPQDVKAVARALRNLCKGEGASVCRNAMIRRFLPGSDATFRKLVRLFGR